jgi:hypothetical protein
MAKQNQQQRGYGAAQDLNFAAVIQVCLIWQPSDLELF